jgi:TMEM175 potassium channel family protein
MKTNRVEAFSDGVMAILITIMVLEFKVRSFAPNVRGIARLALRFVTRHF